MADDVDVNKISDKQQRKADAIEGRLEDQGVGQDDAKNQARQQVADETNTGGKNAAGESQKRTIHGGAGRTGSDSNES